MRSIEGRQQARAEPINGAPKSRRVLREPVKQKKISRQREDGYMILRLKRLQESQRLLARERLIFKIGVERVKKNDDGCGGILPFKIRAIGKHVRCQRMSRYGSGSIRGKKAIF